MPATSMKRLLLSFGATLALLLETCRALDLTPHPTVIQGNEGPPTPAIQIADGTKRILFIPPHDWLPDGGAKSLSLTAPGASGAWMKLLVVAKQDPPQAVLDPAAKAEDVQAWAKQYVPQGAQDVTFLKTVESPFLVLSNPSAEFTFTFARYGRRNSISVAAVEFSATELLVVIYSAEPKDFDDVRRAVIASMFSWRVVK